MFRAKGTINVIMTNIVVLSCILAAGLRLSLAPCAGTVADASGPNVTFKVLIPFDANNRTEVNHIAIRSATQEEIGYELGKLGIEKYGAVLIPYNDPIYGKTKEEYIALHDPVLSKRLKGVKRAYGLGDENYSFDASALLYVLLFPSCSSIYFPPSSTENSHALGGKDLEWFFNPEEDDFAEIAAGDFGTLIANRIRNCVSIVKLYPTNGYATLTIGSLDLLNGAFDGINEKGLAITILQDGDTYVDPITSMAGGTTSGMSFLQVARSILENCATVEDAKERILVNRISMPFMGTHFLIYDASGNATIAEFDNSSRQAIFTNYRNVPVPMINYAVHLNPNFTNVKPYDLKDAHDDYYRIRKLMGYIDNHVGLFNQTDVWTAMSMVEANASSSVEGVLTGGTIRLVYTDIVDLKDMTMTAKFYLRDGPVRDQVWNTREMVLSKPITFRLAR